MYLHLLIYIMKWKSNKFTQIETLKSGVIQSDNWLLGKNIIYAKFSFVPSYFYETHKN